MKENKEVAQSQYLFNLPALFINTSTVPQASTAYRCESHKKAAKVEQDQSNKSRVAAHSFNHRVHISFIRNISTIC
jgi:hypothetical protein